MKRLMPCGLAAAALLAAGCIGSLFNVNLNVVGEQTALEKQVLGTYRSLGEDLMIYSSVRGVDTNGTLKVPPPATDSQRAACAAMRNRQFNRDDIESVLSAGVVAEGNDGFLSLRKEAGTASVSGLSRDQVVKLVEEENGDRRVIIERLAATTPNLTAEQRARIGWIFAGLNQETAPGGAWIQDKDGAWRRK